MAQGVFVIVDDGKVDYSNEVDVCHLLATDGITEVDIYTNRGFYFRQLSTEVFVGRIPCIIKTTQSEATGSWDYEEVADGSGNYYKIVFNPDFDIMAGDPITIKYHKTI